MLAQWGTFAKVIFNQFTQVYRAPIAVQINEQLLKPRNMRIWVGVGNTPSNIGGDGRHDVFAQHERTSVFEESSLGTIAVDERFLGPGGLIRVGTGKSWWTAG